MNESRVHSIPLTSGSTTIVRAERESKESPIRIQWTRKVVAEPDSKKCSEMQVFHGGKPRGSSKRKEVTVNTAVLNVWQLVQKNIYEPTDL